ncbi:MAG: alpha/beta hydrolase [Spirochaetota bacterium]
MQLAIINGTLCNAELWQPLEDSLRSLIHGEIVYPDITGGHNIAEYARNIGAALESPGWILGYSLGGIIALELAQLYPEKICGLILLCTNSDGQTPLKEEAAERQLNLLATEGLESLFEQILLPAYFSETQLREEVEAVAKIKNMGLAMGPDVLRKQLQTLRSRRDQNECLASIRTPALLVCGSEDNLCTAEQNQKMARLLPQSKLERVEGVGHMLPLLRPEALLGAVSDFVSEFRKLHSMR